MAREKKEIFVLDAGAIWRLSQKNVANKNRPNTPHG